MGRLYYPKCRATLQVIFDGFGETDADTVPLVIKILPKSATITRNGYNQADGWELTLDADDFPIDPQLIRSGAIEIHLWGAQGIADDRRLVDKQFNSGEDSSGQDTGKASDQVLEEEGAAGRLDRSRSGQRPAIAGLIDEHGVDYASGGRWVTLTGQDYTALLMERQWPPTKTGRARRIPIGKRLDLQLSNILAEADETGRLSIVVENIKTSELPTIKAQIRAHRRGISVDQKTSYWDVMHQLATRHGFIIFVRGLDVILTKPQNLADDKESRIRQMFWGRNIESLSMERHMGKEKAPNIVIKSYSEGQGKPITVDYPHGHFTKIRAKTGKTSKTGKAGKRTVKNTDEYKIIPVYGITDRKLLAAMAKSFYHQLGRGERAVTFSTLDLTDLSPSEHDLIELSSGDAVKVGFDEFNLDHALLANPDVPAARKEQHLRDRGYGDVVAQVIAERYDELKSLDRPMRVREATIEFGVTEGVRIEVKLVDFITPEGARTQAEREARKRNVRTTLKGKDLGITDAQKKALQRQHGTA